MMTEMDLATALDVPVWFLHPYIRKGTPGLTTRPDGRPELVAEFNGPRKHRDARIESALFHDFIRQWGETVRGDFRATLTQSQRERREEIELETERMHELLPERICVLDVETSGRSPASSGVLCIGLKEFVRSRWLHKALLVATHFEPAHYECFVPDADTAPSVPAGHTIYAGSGGMAALERRLREFPGPIIGHNLFEFDYLFLDKLIDLRGIIEKSADTLYLLWDESGRDLLGLSLDGLGATLGRGKIILNPVIRGGRLVSQGGMVPRLWKEGKYSAVLTYNDRDCDITHDLWWHLVLHREIRILRDFRQISPRMSMANVEELTGHRSRFGYQQWKDERAIQKMCGICGRKVRQRLLYSRNPVDDTPLCGTCVRQRRADERRRWEEMYGGHFRFLKANASRTEHDVIEASEQPPRESLS